MSLRKITIAALTALVATFGYAQKPNVASKSQLTKKATYDVKLRQILKDVDGELVGARQVAPLDHSAAGQTALKATAGINPIKIGRASNVYSHLRQEQNNVYADNSLGDGMVVYLHRHDVTIWGGGASANGKLRYDISIDGGNSFSSDVGVLNSTYTRPARYPNVTGHNPNGETSAVDTKLFYCAPTLDNQPDWDGHVTGYGAVQTSGSPTYTEHYGLLGQNTLLPGGLTRSDDNTFWAVDAAYSGNGDSIYVYKGTYSNNDVSWGRSHALAPNHYTGNNNGSPVMVGPNMEFSPDGTVGWIAWLGDLVGGHDSLLSPCFIKSTDGGVTWGDTSAYEVDLRNIPWIYDSLTSFWVNIDSVTGDTVPAGSGNPTCGFDFDLTVDNNGNPHLVVIIGNGTSPGGDPPAYSIFSGINKFIADIYSSDGGTTWDATYLAPILTFRGEFGTPDDQGALLNMDNVCQASRTPDGTRIFFSWVDSDTSVIGFGESDNLAPNLRIASKRITDGKQTCWKRITDGDQIWDGKIMYPMMSPEVLSATSGNRHYLPLVYFNMVNNDQLGPTEFLYIGNDAQILESDYMDPATLNLQFGAECSPVFVGNLDPIPAGIGFTSFPNPTSGDATVRFNLEKQSDIEIDLLNLYGQKIMDVAQGTFAQGRHDILVNTSSLSDGVYFYSLRVGDKLYSNKMVVTK
ncbi:MAG: T9SS type A sorting domain-containing protein [Bacteroidia bacterium]|nr:T9SS type A sorting domain-containing protein [Bacteroidia bacterium]